VSASFSHRLCELVMPSVWPEGWSSDSGAPKQNQNALKHGVFTRQAIEERKQVQALLQQSRKLLQGIE
jgi:hypothetical protein